MTGISVRYPITLLAAAALLLGCGGAPPAAEPTPPPPTAAEPPEATPAPAESPDPAPESSDPPEDGPPAEGTPRPPQVALSFPADDDRADEATTLDGVYTSDQARRGYNVYRQICSNCHEPPDWQDDAFLARWNGESVYRFWYYIYEQMPEGEPPYTLSREQVTDVVTYIFQLNALPEGAAELGSDEDSIDDHWLYWGGVGVGEER